MRSKIDNIAAIDKGLEWTVYLAVFALPFSKSIIEICAGLGFVLLISKRIVAKDLSFPRCASGLPLLLIFLTSAVSIINSPYPALSVRALFFKTLKFMFLYLLVIEAIDTRRKLMDLLKISAVSCVVIFIDTFLQYFVTHYDVLHNYPTFKYVYNYTVNSKVPTGGYLESFIGYPTGPFPFPNDLSAWLLIVAPIAFFLSIGGLKGKRSRYPVLALAVAGFYLLVLAKARGAWLGLAASSMIFVFLSRRKLAILLIALFVLIAACFIRSPRDIFGFTSMKDRGAMWTTGAEIFKKHPIIGNGINTFFGLYREMRNDEWKGEKGSYAHNCYLQMAADTGVLGLGAFLLFIAALIGRAVRFLRIKGDPFYHSLGTGLVIGLSAFLMHSFFDTNLYSLNLASLFWISSGILASVLNVARNEETLR